MVDLDATSPLRGLQFNGLEDSVGLRPTAKATWPRRAIPSPGRCIAEPFHAGQNESVSILALTVSHMFVTRTAERDSTNCRISRK